MGTRRNRGCSARWRQVEVEPTSLVTLDPAQAQSDAHCEGDKLRPASIGDKVAPAMPVPGAHASGLAIRVSRRAVDP